MCGPIGKADTVYVLSRGQNSPRRGSCQLNQNDPIARVQQQDSKIICVIARGKTAQNFQDIGKQRTSAFRRTV